MTRTLDTVTRTTAALLVAVIAVAVFAVAQVHKHPAHVAAKGGETCVNTQSFVGRILYKYVICLPDIDHP